MLNIINANKDEFLRLIQEPVDQSIVNEFMQQGQQGASNENVVDVSEEELNAIERLAELVNCDKTSAAEA